MSNETWNLPPPPGFQGFREDLPLRVYDRHLPHWRQEGATYFVTFRLADSLPRELVERLRRMREDWARRHPAPIDDEARESLVRAIVGVQERWLDRGHGECLLGKAEHAVLLADSMRHDHGSRHEIGCLVVMPNHVHAIVRPLRKGDELEQIVGSWKQFVARRINAAEGRVGEFWQQESYDRIVRDEEHLWRCIRYVDSNPQKAGLDERSTVRWMNPEWGQLGWGFADPA